jgi:hypothetical protein
MNFGKQRALANYIRSVAFDLKFLIELAVNTTGSSNRRRCTLTDRHIRHNVEVTEIAFVKNEG